MKNIILLALFLLMFHQIFSQTPKIDSLKLDIQKRKDTALVNTLLEMGWEYLYSGMFDDAINTSKKALQKNAKINNSKWRKAKKADTYRVLGGAHLMLGHFQKASFYYSSSLKFYKELEDFKNIATVQMNLGNILLYQSQYDSANYYYDLSIKTHTLMKNELEKADVYMCKGATYFNQGLYPKALKSFYQALFLKEKNKDKNGISGCLNNIASVYITIKEYKKALYYYKKALKIAKEINDQQTYSNCMSNIGVLYNKINLPKKALSYNLKSLALYEQMNFKNGISTSQMNIGLDYYDLKEYIKSETYFLKAIQLKQEINDENGLGQCYMNLGLLYTETKKFDLANQYLEKSKLIFEKLNDLEKLKDTYFNLSRLNEFSNEYKYAYYDLKKYIKFHDSLNKEENIKELLQASMQYEYDKKEALEKIRQEKNNILQAAEKKKQRIILVSVIIGLIMVTFFSIFVYKRLKLTQTQKKIIETQKNAVEIAHQHLEEKNREILDSITYAKRIQSAILPQPKLVKEFLEDSFILYKPKDIVAGDFYWLEVVGDIVLFAAADCTGHGVPGAMVSVVCNNGLNRAVREFGLTKPNEILDKTRELVIQEFEKSDEDVKDGMDISLCALDTNNNLLSWSGAHNPLWIFRTVDKKEINIIEIKADKQPIGKFSDAKPFTIHQYQLQKEDVIYIFTDGFQDQFGGPKEKKFRAAQMKELFLSLNNNSMEEQRKIIDDTFETWKGNLEQVDDVCVIGVRI